MAAANTPSGNSILEILTCSTCSGSGKTYTANTYMSRGIAAAEKYAILQPTTKLCQQTSKDATDRFPKTAHLLRAIFSLSQDDHPVQELHHELLNCDIGGKGIVATHAAFLRIRYWHMQETWNLIVDEVPEVTYYRKLFAKNFPDVILRLFNVLPCGNDHPKYGLLEPVSDGELAKMLDGYKECEITRPVADLMLRLIMAPWHMYVALEQYDAFKSGKNAYLEVHGLLSPIVFDQFKSVTVMSANLEDTLMYHWFKRSGVQFREHPWIMRNLERSPQHQNGRRLKIKYLTPKKWSKKYRDRKITKHGRKISVNDLYLEIADLEARFHSKRPPIWIHNKDVDDTAFDGCRLSNVPHGMNSYQDAEVCVIGSALNPGQSHSDFLKEWIGITDRQIRRAIIVQTAYQSCGRGILRDPDSFGDFLVIVPDQITARDLAAYYPGAEVSQLDIPAGLPDLPELRFPGRPVVYQSDAARLDARRASKREHMRRSRGQKPLNNNKGFVSTSDDQSDMVDLCPFLASLGYTTATEITLLPNQYATPKHPHKPLPERRALPDHHALVALLRAHATDPERKSLPKEADAISPTLWRADAADRSNAYVDGMGAWFCFDVDDTSMTPRQLAETLPWATITANSYSSVMQQTHVSKQRAHLFGFAMRGMTLREHDHIAHEVARLIYTHARGQQHRMKLDDSRLCPGSLYYLPRPLVSGEYFVIDHSDRPLLDVDAFLAVHPVPDEPVSNTPNPILPVNDVRAQTAITEWRSRQPRTRNYEYNRLAWRLAGFGMADDAILQVLQEEANSQSSRQAKNDCTNQIDYIMRGLAKRSITAG